LPSTRLPFSLNTILAGPGNTHTSLRVGFKVVKTLLLLGTEIVFQAAAWYSPVILTSAGTVKVLYLSYN
jgi:hypothetical protein